MCVVSMVMDHYGRGGGPILPPQPIIWPPAGPVPLPPIQWPPAAPVERPWDAESLALLKAAMELLRKLDSKLGLPDCEDPKKAAWLKAIEAKVSHDEWGRKR
jgi:hypothetical protein